jgi:hypothetical protein
MKKLSLALCEIPGKAVGSDNGEDSALVQSGCIQKSLGRWSCVFGPSTVA